MDRSAAHRPGLRKLVLQFLVTAATIITFVPAQAEEKTAENAYNHVWTPLQSGTIDAIIANVGGKILLLSDLQRAVTVASRGQAALLPTGKIQGQSVSSQQVAELFDKLIEQSLLELKVEEMGLEVTESELDQEIAKFLESRNITRGDFLSMLEQEGETEASHRSEFKRQLETQRFIGRAIRPLVSVSDEEVKSFALSQATNDKKPQQTAEEKYVLRSLLISGRSSDPQGALKVKSVQKALNSGSPFEEVVKIYSDAADAQESGGLLEPKLPSTLPPELVKALEGAAEGKVVGPLEIGSTTFFFQLVSREKSSISQTSEKIDLEKWKQRLLEVKFAERLQSYLDAERDKVNVEKRPIRFH